MGFPRVVRHKSGKTILANSFTIDIPDVEAGQTILLLMAFTTVATPSLGDTSFTELINESTGGAFGVQLMAWYKVASSSEASTSITCNTSSAIAAYVYNCLVIDNLSDTTPRVSSVTDGEDTAPDSDELTLVEKTNALWLSVMAADDAQDVEFPGDYDLLGFYSSTSVGPTLAVAGYNFRAISEDPAAFYIGSSDNWLAATFAFINNNTTWTRYAPLRERSAKSTIWRLPDENEHILNTGSPEDLLIDPEDMDVEVPRVQESSTVWSPQSFEDASWTTFPVITADFYVSEF